MYAGFVALLATLALAPSAHARGVTCGLVPVDGETVIQQDKAKARSLRSGARAARRCLQETGASIADCFTTAKETLGPRNAGLGLVQDMFGPEFSTVLASESAAPSRCQRRTARRALRLAARQVRADVSCRKQNVANGTLKVCWDKIDCVAGSDTVGVTKGRTRLQSAVEKCASKFDLPALFPGDCSARGDDTVGYGNCLGTLPQCTVCGELTSGCFMDCKANASCDTRPFGSTSTTTCTIPSTTTTSTTTTLRDCCGSVTIDPETTLAQLEAGVEHRIPLRVSGVPFSLLDLQCRDGDGGGLFGAECGTSQGVLIPEGGILDTEFTYLIFDDAPPMITLTVEVSPHSPGSSCGSGCIATDFRIFSVTRTPLTTTTTTTTTTLP